MNVSSSCGCETSTRSRRRSKTHVLVAHRCAVLAAGIAGALRARGGFTVFVVPPSATHLDGLTIDSPIDVLVGDPASARRLIALASRGAPEASPVPLVTLTQDAEATTDIAQRHAACLPMECGEHELLAAVRIAAASRPRGGLAPGVLRRVREYIDHHLDDRLDIDDLAAMAALSPCHFARAFRQSLGVAPSRYVLQRRLVVAEQMIRETDRAVSEIAFALGFSDQSHLTRHFATRFGRPPQSYRRSRPGGQAGS